MNQICKAKQALRKELACQRRGYSKTWLSELSVKALERLENTVPFRNAKNIAIYHAIQGEVETTAFLDKWSAEKQFILPVVEGDKICLYAYEGPETLIPGKFGIREPIKDICSIFSGDIDLFVVPGVAFDRKGNRLGRGKGYYDRLLSCSGVIRTGLCFHFQLFEEIPVEPFDVIMDMIITDRETVQISSAEI